MEEIKQLLKITKRLADKYGRSFTLDGKLVGDIGEVLAAEKYDLELLSSNSKVHDARQKSTNKLVQIKSSMSNRSYFPCNHVPNYFIAIQILENGDIVELFNGKGSYIVKNYIKKKGLTANNGRYLYTLSGAELKKLNRQENNRDKVTVTN